MKRLLSLARRKPKAVPVKQASVDIVHADANQKSASRSSSGSAAKDAGANQKKASRSNKGRNRLVDKNNIVLQLHPDEFESIVDTILVDVMADGPQNSNYLKHFIEKLVTKREKLMMTKKQTEAKEPIGLGSGKQRSEYPRQMHESTKKRNNHKPRVFDRWSDAADSTTRRARVERNQKRLGVPGGATYRQTDKKSKLNNNGNKPLTVGSQVWYKGNEIATIVGVHRNDPNPPYYTISINGHERQTVREKLEPYFGTENPRMESEAKAKAETRPKSRGSSAGVENKNVTLSFEERRNLDNLLGGPAAQALSKKLQTVSNIGKEIREWKRERKNKKAKIAGGRPMKKALTPPPTTVQSRSSTSAANGSPMMQHWRNKVEKHRRTMRLNASNNGSGSSNSDGQ